MSDAVERWNLAPDLSISRVLTGLWQVADMERDGETLDPESAARSMEPYVRAGFTTFDMADHYGSSEVIVGHYVAAHGREDVQLLTKWVPRPGPTTAEQVRRAVDRARTRMQVDTLDLMQFHAWTYDDPSWLDAMFRLQELRDEGLVRHLGVTNFDTDHLRMALESGLEIVSNQVCFSLLDRRARDNGMLDLCRKRGVSVLAFGTLGGGFLTDRWLDAPEPDWDDLETWSQMKYGRFLRQAGGWDALQELLTVVRRLADAHGVSMANVACRYILDQPAVAGVIVGARLGISEHRDDNARVFAFALDEADHAALDEAVTRLQPIPGDCGDEYRRPPYLTAAGDLSDHLDSLPAPYEARAGDDGRTRVLTGTVWEDLAGFSRAVRRGDRILVSGTTATHGERVVGGTDPEAQTHFVIDKIEGALRSLGAGLADVVRTRIYLQRMEDWEAVSRAHGRRFGAIRPANTLLQAGIVGDEYLVEMEVEALVDVPSPE